MPVSDLTPIQDITQRLVDSHPVNWGYTAAAYTGNDIEGVASFNLSNDMNVPLDTAVDTSTNTLNWGLQTQGASIARRLLNHMFGRMSYNIRKLTDQFYAFTAIEKSQWALNAYKYDSAQAYHQYDICFTYALVSGIYLIKYWIRTSSSPLTITGVDPTAGGSDWTLAQDYTGVYPEQPVNAPGYRRSYSLVDLTGGGYLTTTWYPVVSDPLGASAVVTPQDANTILTEVEAYVAGAVTGQAHACRASLSAIVKTSGWNVASGFDSAAYPTSALIKNQLFIDDVTGADLGISNSPIGFTMMPKGKQVVYWLRGGSKYGLWNSFGATFSVKTSNYDNGAGDPIISPQTSRQFAYNPMKNWGRFAVPAPVISEDATNRLFVENIGKALATGNIAGLIGATDPAMLKTSAMTVNGGSPNTNVNAPEIVALFGSTIMTLPVTSVNVQTLGAAGAGVKHKLYITFAADVATYAVTTGAIPGGALLIGTFTFNSGSSPITLPFCASLNSGRYDFVVDSNDKVDNWAACSDSAYKRVRVVTGSWSASKLGATAGTLLDFTKSGTTEVVAERGSNIVYSASESAGIVGVNGAASLAYDTQIITGLKLTLTNTHASAAVKGFLLCGNMSQCNAVLVGNGIGMAYDNCQNMFACLGTVTAPTASAFSRCINVNACDATLTSSGSGSATAIVTSGKNIRNCHITVTSTGTSGFTAMSGNVTDISGCWFECTNASGPCTGANTCSNIRDCLFSFTTSTGAISGLTSCSNVSGCTFNFTTNGSAANGNMLGLSLCQNVSECVLNLTSGTSTATLTGINGGARISNILMTLTGTGTGACVGVGPTSEELTNIKVTINSNASSGSTVGFSVCHRLSNCYASVTTTANVAYGFGSCDLLSSCIAVAAGTSGSAGFASCTQLSACSGTGSTIATGQTGYGFDTCTDVASCIGSGTGSGAGEGVGFISCVRCSSCEGTGTGGNANTTGTGFEACSDLVSCVGTGNGGNTNGEGRGFHGCDRLADCVGVASGVGSGNSIAFHTCTRLSSCTGTANATTSGFGYGFHGCTTVSSCWGTGNGGSSSGNGRGFNSCVQVVGCQGVGLAAGSGSGHGFFGCTKTQQCSARAASKTATYNTTFADSGSANAAADTAAGGYNS